MPFIGNHSQGAFIQLNPEMIYLSEVGFGGALLSRSPEGALETAPQAPQAPQAYATMRPQTVSASMF